MVMGGHRDQKLQQSKAQKVWCAEHVGSSGLRIRVMAKPVFPTQPCQSTTALLYMDKLFVRTSAFVFPK